jgi:phage shock protein PspC (stress-responsive transcriptional regulator)
MFCTKCGIELDERDGYCRQCGTATGRQTLQRPATRLMRTRLDKKIAGVCGGMAKYLDLDPTLMRVLWLLLLFALPPAGLIGYIAAWIVMPKEPEPYPPVVATAQASTPYAG